jgi:hypothetical protein
MKIKHIAVCDKGHEYEVREAGKSDLVAVNGVGMQLYEPNTCPQCEAEKPRAITFEFKEIRELLAVMGKYSQCQCHICKTIIAKLKGEYKA